MKKHALGMVVKDRWDITLKSLQSIYYSDQDKGSFDVYLIDNGSTEENVNNIKEFVKSGMLPVKNLFCMSEMSISKAWNLFLSVARNYECRTKYDNDLVLCGTISPSEPKPAGLPPEVPMGGTNPGAIASGPPIRGIGQHRHKKPQKGQTHTAFLDHLFEFNKTYNVDLSALVPVTPGQPFDSMMAECASQTWQGMPYLFGACMMMSKKCFDTFGYFDERLSRRIDIEYTQRVIKQGFNIGYHPSFYVNHIGAANSTEPENIRLERYEIATKIGMTAPLEGYEHSSWEKILPRLDKSANKSKVLCLS